MNKFPNVVRNINEGYQPIINNRNNKSVPISRPSPPRGGSGVPNLSTVSHISPQTNHYEISSKQNK